MYCQEPLTNCNGCVIPRDILLVLEGKWDTATMGMPRELCQKFACARLWHQQLQQEDPQGDYKLIWDLQ
jgi:hypothetical protein